MDLAGKRLETESGVQLVFDYFGSGVQDRRVLPEAQVHHPEVLAAGLLHKSPGHIAVVSDILHLPYHVIPPAQSVQYSIESGQAGRSAVERRHNCPSPFL